MSTVSTQLAEAATGDNAHATLEEIVTFRSTHSNFADIIQAEIFKPDLSNSIPNPSLNFAYFRVLPRTSRQFRHSQNLWTMFHVLSFDPVSKYFVPELSLLLCLIVSHSLVVI